MRRVSYVACVAVLVAGCGDRDPATSRLKAGQAVRIRVEPAFLPHDSPKPGVHLGRDELSDLARDGDRAEVIADDRPADVRQGERYPDGDLEVDRRKVRVRVLSGQSADREGELTRNELRPE